MESTIPLLERYHAGDPTVLETILAQHYDWLWRFVSRNMGDHLRAFETSEDVVQEVLRQLIEHGPAFVPQDDSQFRRLVGTIVLNRLRDRNDHARAARRDRRREASGEREPISRIGVAAPSTDGPSQAAIRKEEASCLELALELMPPDDAYIIRRRRWDGAEFHEIGEELGLKPDAVQKRHVRSVAKLGGMIRRLEAGDLSGLAPDPLVF